MDKEKTKEVIQAIRERPPLWNHGIRGTKSNSCLWKEVAEICNLPVEKVKQRWKTLRKTHRAQFPLMLNPRKGAKTKWYFFDMMRFVTENRQNIKCNPERTARKSKVDAAVALTSSEDEDSVHEIELIPMDVKNENMSFVMNECNDDSIMPTPMCELSQMSTQPFRDGELNNATVSTTRQEKVHSKISSYDADLQFFQSLLPFMDSFDDVQKLELRGDIQNIILKKLKTI